MAIPPPRTPERTESCSLTTMMSPSDRSLLSLFEIRGFLVTALADGKAAIAAIEQGYPFDFLLTDLRLPDVDGREVALRASQRRPRPLISLMTGWDPDQEDRARWGIDLIFIKPVDTAEVVSQFRLARQPGLAG